MKPFQSVEKTKICIGAWFAWEFELESEWSRAEKLTAIYCSVQYLVKFNLSGAYNVGITVSLRFKIDR